MQRITRKLEDGRIAADLTGEDPLERLWRYENTGYEPESIAPRQDESGADK